MAVETDRARSDFEDFLGAFLRDLNAGGHRSCDSYCTAYPAAPTEIKRCFHDLTNPNLRFGDYQAFQALGQGGQAAVYLALDMKLARKVALKVLPTGTVAASTIDRFRREAEITSKLDHPGICTVYETGETHGQHWIAMRYVEGDSLAQKVSTAKERLASGNTTTFVVLAEREGPKDVEVDRGPVRSRSGPKTRGEIAGVLALFEDAARALHVAHEAGVIHRDIKPGNLIVTKRGDPVILDFGLAQDVEGEHSALTQTGDIMGTPAYMSPEQIAAQRIKLDRRTDVYSLGVSLFECLALRRPFDAPTRDGLYQAILTKEPPDLRSLNASVPSDLRVVVATALEKDRDRRYQTALDFAEELRRVRMHEPIVAKRIGPLVRLQRWAQRNPVVAGLLLLIGALTPMVIWFWVSREYAQESSARTRDQLRSLLRVAGANEENYRSDSGDLERVGALLTDPLALGLSERELIALKAMQKKQLLLANLKAADDSPTAKRAETRSGGAQQPKDPDLLHAYEEAVGAMRSMRRPSDSDITAFEGRLSELSTRLKDDDSAARLWIEWGNALRRQYRFDDALRAFDRATQMLPKFDWRELGVISLGRGKVMATLSRFAEALEAFADAEGNFKKAGDEPGLAEIALNRGIVMTVLSRYSAALEAYRQAEDYYKTIADEGILAQIAVNRGIIFRSLGRVSEALDAFDQAAAYFKKAGDEERLAWIAVNRGSAFASSERFSEALDEYNQADAYFRKVEDEGSLALTALNRGNALQSLARNEEALAAYDQADVYFRKVGDEGRLASIALNRGNALQSLARNEEALAAYDQADVYFRKVGDEGRLASIALNRGNALQSLARNEEALVMYENAEPFYAKVGDQGRIAAIAEHRGKVLTALQRADEAQSEFKRAATILQRLGDTTGLSRVADLMNKLRPESR